MKITNMVNYVCEGLESIPDQEDFRTHAVCGVMLAACAASIPVTSDTTIGWHLLGYSFVIIAFIVIIIVFKIASKELTVERRLILRIVIYVEYVFQLSMIGTMYFLLYYGFRMTILWIYLPVITIPLLRGWLMHRRMNSDREYIPYETQKVELKWTRFGVSAGNIGAIMIGNAWQSKTIMIIIILWGVVNCFMSWGLIDIQKLYYYKKYNLSEHIK